LIVYHNQNFLQTCIVETVRLQAPTIFTGRVVVKEQVCDSYLIPKGHFVCVSPYLKHRKQEYYEKPNEFNPEHFEHSVAEARMKNDPYSFLGFGLGRHKCIGEFYSYYQIKIIITKLLQNYSIKLTGNAPSPDIGKSFVGIMHPKESCAIVCTKIN